MNSSPSIASALGHATADKRIEILRLTGRTGSISQAAREAGISYKAAWQAVQTLTNLAGAPLVEKVVGGAGGGGAKLTADGARLLETADLLDKTRREVLRQLQGRSAGAVASTISRLSIRTSMRNHLPCTVHALEWRDQTVRALLRLGGDQFLAARITRASAELLALAEGQPVLALCKATAVEVGSRNWPGARPGLNLLQGHAARITRGSEEDEIFSELDSGLQLVGFAPADRTIRMCSRVTAAVEESAVVIALVE